MQTLEPILAEHPFLAGLPQAHVALLVGCASNVRFDAGHFICREGDEADAFYIVRQGRVGIEVFKPDRGPIVIDTIEAGEILGWSWLLPPYRWHFDARVLEATRAVALDGKCLRAKCEQDHDLGYELLKRFGHLMEQRLQAARFQLLDVYAANR